MKKRVIVIMSDVQKEPMAIRLLLASLRINK